MKEVKADVHRGRAADVIQALDVAGFKNLSATDVKGFLEALSAQEQSDSIELGGRVIDQVKIEKCCASALAERAALIIRNIGRTGQTPAGWVYQNPVDAALPIDAGEYA